MTTPQTTEKRQGLAFRSAPQPALILIALMTLCWVATMWSSVDSMVKIWLRSDTFAHGLVVLPISAYLVWRQRARLADAPIRVSALGIAFSVLSAVAWALAVVMSVASAEHLTAVGVLVFTMWAVLGSAAFRVIAFPAFFLFFMAPVGDFMIPALIHHTAEFTVGALRFTGIPVYQEGNEFIVPNGRWSVVEACSGIRYLIASAMVGALYAYLNYRSLTKRVVFCLFALAVPIVANWMRAYLIVLIGYLSSNRLAAGVDHLIYGWLFFGVVILLMFWIGKFWSDPSEPAEGIGAGVGDRAALPWSSLVAGCTLLITPFVLQSFAAPQERSFSIAMASPVAATGWRLVEAAPSPFLHTVHGQRGTVEASYRSPAGVAHLQVVIFEDQAQDHEMVNWENKITPGRGWSASRPEIVPLETRSFRQMKFANGASVINAWSSYLVGGKWIEPDVSALLALAWNRILTGSDRSARVLIWVEGDDPEIARVVARQFFVDHREGIERAVESATEGG